MLVPWKIRYDQPRQHIKKQRYYFANKGPYSQSYGFSSQRRRWHPTLVLLPGKSHGQRSLVGCSPWGHEESETTEQLHFHFSLSCIGEGNGSPLQCSCLENPRDGGAWWAAVYGSHRAGHDWSDLAAAAAVIVVWPWANQFLSLISDFLICKVRWYNTVTLDVFWSTDSQGTDLGLNFGPSIYFWLYAN